MALIRTPIPNTKTTKLTVFGHWLTKYTATTKSNPAIDNNLIALSPIVNLSLRLELFFDMKR
jgi:hypothetical protein